MQAMTRPGEIEWIDELYIVNYSHHNCVPGRSITRLPEAEAYATAKRLAAENEGTSIGRFADFANYYPLRMRTEAWLHERFIALGGAPRTEHPLYFVLHQSAFLDDWFGNGKVTRLPLSGIDARHISFTYGDSMAQMDRPTRQPPFTKADLAGVISGYKGIEAFLDAIREPYTYIEAQLWNDDYLEAIDDGGNHP